MSNHNPLIDSTMPDQTLLNVSAAVSYLAMVEPVKGCELGEESQHGLYLLLSCVSDALDYEAGRVKAMRTEGKS